jgi:hypothetical protein
MEGERRGGGGEGDHKHTSHKHKHTEHTRNTVMGQGLSGGSMSRRRPGG